MVSTPALNFMMTMYNTMFAGLNLEYPASYPICFNNNKAKIDWSFLQQLANVCPVQDNFVLCMDGFFNGYGFELYQDMLNNWESCSAWQSDLARFSKAIGTSITGTVFNGLADGYLNFIDGNSLFKNLVTASVGFAQLNGELAGEAYLEVVRIITFPFQVVQFY